MPNKTTPTGKRRTSQRTLITIIVIFALGFLSPFIRGFFQPTKSRVERAREHLTSASNKLQMASQMVESADSILMKAGKTNWVKSNTTDLMDKLQQEKMFATIELSIEEKIQAADFTLKEYNNSNDAFYAQAVLHLAGLDEANAGPLSESEPTGGFVLKVPSNLASRALEALKTTSVSSLGLHDRGMFILQQVNTLKNAGIKATIVPHNQIKSAPKMELLVLTNDKQKAMQVLGLQ